jgi:peptide/nickel transport system substrate-binding protein
MISGEGGDGEYADNVTIGLQSDITREFWGLYGGVSPYWTRVLEPLIWVSRDFSLEPWLATDWERTGDRTWEFTIREGVNFHNGDELDATHVVHSIETLLEDFPQARFTWRLQDLEDEPAVALDDRTVEFTTREGPFAGFAAGLAHNMVCVQHPDTNADEDRIVATGPYQVTEIESEQRVEVEAFDDYWGGSPATPELTYRVIVDPTTRALAMERELDIGFQPPKTEVQRLEDDEDTEVLQQLSTRVGLVNFNLERQPTDDADLRRALNHAVSQQAIVESIMEGLAEPARGPIGSIVDFSAYDSLPAYEKDLDRARNLVEASSYDGETLRIHVSNEAQADWVPEESVLLAELLQDNAQEIGVDMDIQVSEYSAFTDRWRGKEGHMYMFLWGPKSGASDYILFRYHSRENTHFSLNDEFDGLIEQGERASDEDERTEAYVQAQELMMDEAVVLPMYEHKYLMAVDRRIEDFDTHTVHEFIEMKDLRMKR